MTIKPASKKAHMRTVHYLLVATATAVMLSPWFATLALAVPKDSP